MKEEKDTVSVDKHKYIIVEQINTEDDKSADDAVVKEVRNHRYDDYNTVFWLEVMLVPWRNQQEWWYYL